MRIRTQKPSNKMNYTTNRIFLDDMGTVPSFTVSDSSPMETKEQAFLWHVNRMRDHDHLPHLTEVPNDVEFTPVEEEL
jgi:hypothetical protein